jgi:hypothetical protein
VEKARRRLHEFVRNAWPLPEPETPFVEGMHVGAACDPLQAVAEGRIRVLIVNIRRRSAIEWWNGSMATRLNDFATGHKIVIVQRKQTSPGICWPRASGLALEPTSENRQTDPQGFRQFRLGSCNLGAHRLV